jgi:multiple sugar transport system substrate-binding protein
MAEIEDRERGDIGAGSSRREFLKKAAIVGAALPAASVLAPDAMASKQIRVRDLARPFEGVTLSLAKAPHGTDEMDFFKPWLAKFEKQTGAKVKHTIVPWNVEGAAYLTNYSGPNPYDVSYQTSTDLTSLGTKGVLMDLTSAIKKADWASERKHFPNSIFPPSVFKGKLYGLPFIIGTIVMFYNKDLMAKSGVASVPTNTDELTAAAQKIQKGQDIWGFQTPMTNKDFNWYFNLQNVHNFGGDILAKDFKSATINSDPVSKATQYATDLITKYKVSPPIGAYDREGGVSLFKGGRVGFLLDEPLRVAVFQKEKLPFQWDIAAPVGAPGGRRTEFSTTGHWVVAQKSAHRDAAWALVKFLSTAGFSKAFNSHYGFVPVRNDVDVSKGNPLLKKNLTFAKSWDGLKTHPKIAQLLDVYGQTLEAAASGNASVADALAKGQADAAKVLGQSS